MTTQFAEEAIVKRAVVGFVDIEGCSALSNALSLAEYDKILCHFHRAVSNAYDLSFQLRKLGDKYVNDGKENPERLEFSARGDEACFILHSGPLVPPNAIWTSNAQKLYTDAVVASEFIACLQFLWIGNEYSQERLDSGLEPIRLSVGLHYGPVVTKKRPFRKPACDNIASEGFSINLAKRIEGQSRKGKLTRVVASEQFRSLAVAWDTISDRYGHDGDAKNLFVFSTEPLQGDLKGITQAPLIYEVSDIRLGDFRNQIDTDHLFRRISNNGDIEMRFNNLAAYLGLHKAPDADMWNPSRFWIKELMNLREKTQFSAISGGGR